MRKCSGWSEYGMCIGIGGPSHFGVQAELGCNLVLGIVELRWVTFPILNRDFVYHEVQIRIFTNLSSSVWVVTRTRAVGVFECKILAL